MKSTSFWHNVVCIGRRMRACKRLSEAAKTLTTRDHVRGISGPSTLFINYLAHHKASLVKVADILIADGSLGL
jgi:hypothetical protein